MSSGAQINSRAFKRIILNASSAAAISGNTSNLDKILTASDLAKRNATVVYGEVSVLSGLPNVSVSTPALTGGATLQAGADYRLSEKTFISLATAYHYSFQHLQNCTDNFTTSFGIVSITFSNTGNCLSFTMGHKRTIGEIGQAQGYNSYNAPFLRTYFSQEEPVSFEASKWLLSLAGGYWSGKLP